MSTGIGLPHALHQCSCGKNIYFRFHEKLSCFVICLGTDQWRVTEFRPVFKEAGEQLEQPLDAGPQFFGKSNFISTNMHK